jgi:ABC-type transport system substrate-binding protein
VGIELTPKVFDVAAGANLMRTSQATSFVVAPSINDPSGLTSNFHSRNLGSSVVSGAITSDAGLDALLDQAAAEADPSRQCADYDTFQQRYLDTLAAFPIWETTAPAALRRDIGGVRLVPVTGSMPMFQEVHVGA